MEGSAEGFVTDRQRRGPDLALRLWQGLCRPLIAVQGARGHLLPLAVVAMGIGVGLWFDWPAEPGNSLYLLVLAAGLAGFAGLVAGPDLLRPLGGLVLALAIGFLAAGLRAHLQAAPMLDFRYYGPVEGRVVEIDRSATDAVRVTLDRVVLERVAPDRTPARVRVSLRGRQTWHEPSPGEVVILTATLSAPEGAVEPGGFDFRRMAFFDRLGAVGYTTSPVLLLEEPGPAAEVIGRLRMYFSSGIKAVIPGEAGAFASGAMTGDRSGISQATVEALRDSSLAHILAISGMNLAVLATFVFALIRYGIACIPPLALRVNAKKASAVLSFFVAWFYLALSGSNVATERAFLMISVMLIAVVLDRRAISMRSAAVAAGLMLLFRPESLLAPGFQMSMAATVALIWGFRALEGQAIRGHIPRAAVPVVTVVLSSVIGGFATAPYAAASFNRFADYGLIANLLTVPIMGVAIMPMGVLAFLLAPIGLHWIPLWVMGKASEWILFVAYRVAAMEGSVTAIPAPAPLALPIVTLGGLWLMLWPGRARLAGAVVLAAGLIWWPMGTRPVLLISGDGRIAGLMGPEGRAISTPGGGGFSAVNWLESDADLVAQEVAATRRGFSGPSEARQFRLGEITAVILHGKRGLALLEEECAKVDLVILAGRPGSAPVGCKLIHADHLRQSGPLAIHATASGHEIRAVRAPGRIWAGGRADLTGLARDLPPGLILPE